ncbi:hypothetical protein HPB50_006075 [Hyalomma asiaticum]|uniref:Uncharacterized protein n=1 Tax=Hyalomma asiaticum TaxID=266040 RepID=A0ACB7SVY8_HYAAI|nr:hypothetical protein HPB50_006075 [Hyalomma asiaticum]
MAGRHSEGGSPSSPPKEEDLRPAAGAGRILAVQVHLLDETVTTFNVQYKAAGRVLFDQVCRVINLLEVDYFGLEYLFSLQIKRDLSQGLLQCSDPTAALLASYIVQASCGDYVAEDYPDASYLSSYKFVPHQDAALEARIMECHQRHVGQSPAQADLNLLETARRCELYGVRLSPARDSEGLSLNLAVAHMGVMVFQGTTRINTFSWAKIRKLSFKRKRFLIKLHPEGYGYYKDTVEYFFESRNECKNFWKKCIENHAFFRCTEVKKSPRQKARLFSRGSSFRYSGRTQKQIVEYVRENYVKRQPFQRSTSLRLPSHGSAGASDNEENIQSVAAATSEPSSPRRDTSRDTPRLTEGAVTPSQDTDDNISHDSYRLEEGDSSIAAPTPSADNSSKEAGSLVNGGPESGRRRSGELSRASRSFDEEDSEFGYVLHRRGFLRDSRMRRSEGHPRRRPRTDMGRGSRQSSPPTIFARARALGPRVVGSVDFVHLAQLPRADSFSSHDDSLEEDSLEKEIMAVLRKKKLLGDETARSSLPSADVPSVKQIPMEQAVQKAQQVPTEQVMQMVHQVPVEQAVQKEQAVLDVESDLSLELASVPLPEESLMAQLSPIALGPTEDALLGGLVGIPPPPEYRSSAVNEVLRKYEELERSLALELSRLGCPPPPALPPLTVARSEASLARPEDISDSSNGLAESDVGEDALRLDTGSDDTLGESPERTFSEEEETALVGDEPTLCSSPFSSSVPETPEAQYPSFVDLDVIVGSGLLEPSSSSSSMLSSYSKNGHPLDFNPFLQ